MSEAFYQLEREFVVHSSFLSFVTVCSQATRTFHWGRKLLRPDSLTGHLESSARLWTIWLLMNPSKMLECFPTPLVVRLRMAKVLHVKIFKLSL